MSELASCRRCGGRVTPKTKHTCLDIERTGYAHRRGERETETRQTKLFVDAVGWQKCDAHGEYNPHAAWSALEIEEMIINEGYIDCPYCMVEIGGVFQP